MKLYHLTIKYPFSFDFVQVPESFPPFGTEKEALDKWEEVKPRIQEFMPQAFINEIEISIEDILLILLKNFAAMQDVLAKGQIVKTTTAI